MSLNVKKQRRNDAEVKWSSSRFWIWRLKLLRSTGLIVSNFTPTASCSITSALLLKSGSRDLIAPVSLILMNGNASTIILTALSLVVMLSSWRCDCAKVMEVIAGSWLVLTRYAAKRDRLRVGMLPGRT